jgi:hypothetical protein
MFKLSLAKTRGSPAWMHAGTPLQDISSRITSFEPRPMVTSRVCLCVARKFVAKSSWAEA